MARFRHVNTYPDTTVEQVHAMLLDRGFREEVCAAMHAVAHAVVVDTDVSPPKVRVTQTQVARKIPTVAQKLIGETVEIVQSETWISVDEATIDMGIPGKPGQLRGTLRLLPTDGGVEQVVEGELKVAVPLVGGKLEGLVADLLGKALGAEQGVGLSWLDRHRG